MIFTSTCQLPRRRHLRRLFKTRTQGTCSEGIASNSQRRTGGLSSPTILHTLRDVTRYEPEWTLTSTMTATILYMVRLEIFTLRAANPPEGRTRTIPYLTAHRRPLG